MIKRKDCTCPCHIEGRSIRHVTACCEPDIPIKYDMRIYSSNIVGPKLLELLGIPIDNCTKATIVIEPDKVIKVEAEYEADLDPEQDYKAFKTIVKSYKMVLNEKA